jgi:hypothetical protein
MQRLSACLLLAMREAPNLQYYRKQIDQACANLIKVNNATLLRTSCELMIEVNASEIL